MGDRGDSPRVLEVLGRRFEFLERLGDAPAHKRDLVDEMDHSRSTINRALSELEDVGLVERDGDGFVATTAGRLAVERYGSFRRELSDIVAADPVLDPLPADETIGVEFVAGSDAALSTDPAPYRPLERFHDDLAAAERYRAVLPSLDDQRHVRLLYEHVVTRDRPATVVVAPQLFDALREEFPRRTAVMAEREGFDVHVGDVPPYALALVEGEADADDPATTGWAVVFTENGGVHGVLENRTASAVRWAERRYATALAAAEERTDDLRPDADGGVAADDRSDAHQPGESLPVALERAGFVRLGTDYFREEPVADPATAWRAGLTVPEVHTGYAVERTIDDGRSMTTALTDDLASGTDCVVVGPPGAGKSTICKRVACGWYDDDRGPVLYREGGHGRPFDAVADLELAVAAADGHTLVVVEDAVRLETDAIFDAIDRLAGREDVSFLLDAREHEWRNPPGDPAAVDGLAVHPMPAMDETDCRRLVEQFERTVGESVDAPVERLRATVRDESLEAGEAAPNEVLLLLHRLAAYADPLVDGDTSLEAAVAELYDDLAGDDLALDVCTLANVLNAAGLAVHPGLLYAVADPEAFDAVDAAVDQLAGRVLFSREGGPYRTVHESWSTAFLAHLSDAEGPAAADRFGRVVSRLLALADSPDRCERIAAHLDVAWEPVAVTDDSEDWAADTLEAVYATARGRPKLAPLFGDGGADTVAVPAACPDEVAARRPLWLGRLFIAGGYYDRAKRAFERVGEAHAVDRRLGLARVANARGDYDAAVDHAEACLELAADEDPAARAGSRRAVGRALLERGDYDAARATLTDALEGFETVGDRRAAAAVLDLLGRVAKGQGDYEAARSYHERSLEASRALGDRVGEAESLGRLGEVARPQDEYDRAREHHEHRLDVARALGDRPGVAASLQNLGEVAYWTGAYDDAEAHFERALSLARDLGDPTREAAAASGFGMIANDRGDYDRSREQFRQALAFARDVDDRQLEATTLARLGLTAARAGDLEAARERLERSLALLQEIGDREGEAGRCNNLGLVSVRLGDHDAAREYFRQGLEIAREVGAPTREANGHNGLGHVARMCGRYDRAREHHEQALEILTEHGNRRRETDTRNHLGQVARGVGDLEVAGEYHGDALALAEELDHPKEAIRSRCGLAAVARRRDDLEGAADHLTAAEELTASTQDTLATARFELAAGRLALARGEVGTARDRATAARDRLAAMGASHWTARARRLLGRVAAAADDFEAAREHLEAALATFEDLGAPQDALPTLRHLADACEAAGDADGALSWCRRAEAVRADAPEAVAACHGEWVAARLGDGAD